MAHENQAPFGAEPPPADPADREAASPDEPGPAATRDLPPAAGGVGAPAASPGAAALPAPADLYGHPEPARGPGSPPWPAERGLFWWLVGLLAFGVGGVVLGQQELAALVAVSGLFVAAQAADHDPHWTALYYALSWVVPVGAAMTFVAVTVLLYQGELPGWPRWALIAFSCASIVACAAMVYHPVSDRLVRRLFHSDRPTHSLRLSARLVAAGLLLAIPGWFALRDVFADNAEQIVEQIPLASGLIGYVMLALASVGFLVRRDVPSTLDRLGLRLPGVRDLAVVALGVTGLIALNNGADWMQQHLFPGLWKLDQEFNQTLASNLSRSQSIMLGLSAGVGEEITMRGALQPRLGLGLTSLLFAALHVQYSWYGMLVIFVLGVVLGVIRQRTSTTVAMAVHVIYDIVAILTT